MSRLSFVQHFIVKEFQFFSVSFPFPRPKCILVRRILTPIFSQTRTPAESSRRCCRRWRDKSYLSLLSSLSQADTRELTDRTVAIKLSSPLLRPFERSTPGRFPWLCYGVHVREERRAGNKRTQAQDARKGDEARVSTTLARDAHEEDLLVAAGSWDHRKKKRRGSRERGRNGGGPGEDAALVRRGQYLREGLGPASFSATERNCTGWATLIYWVITDLGAKRAWCMGFLARAGPSRSLSSKMAFEKNALNTHMFASLEI